MEDSLDLFDQVPTSALRAKSGQIMRGLQNGGAPVCLTNYNKTVGYLVSPDHFEPLVKLNDIVRANGYLSSKPINERALNMTRAYVRAQQSLLDQGSVHDNPFYYLLQDALGSAAEDWAQNVLEPSRVVLLRWDDGVTRSGFIIEKVYEGGTWDRDLDQPTSSAREALVIWNSRIRHLRNDFGGVPGRYVAKLMFGDDEVCTSREMIVGSNDDLITEQPRIAGRVS
ncbi:hypothetical protein [Lentzea sp. NBRC 102530]|uniref:hypothetical protein n=1 Tax=Lentzea sp. NBRC 102530 TaxID=3032201 RepID=UPI00255588E0|nr:hypothetical protein [Lentzea sp. NBRC 102530]